MIHFFVSFLGGPGEPYVEFRGTKVSSHWRPKYKEKQWNMFFICDFILILDFIECFTTTFLRAHSWLNWVDEDDDEDEVGLKEKPEDTRYIKKIRSK